jgi:uncharacterized protein YbjT (DUF2867 family)
VRVQPTEEVHAMSIVITGASGTIGRHVVEQLAAAGHPVRAVSRDPAAARLPDRVEVVRADLTEPDTVARALRGATALHLIAIAGDDYGPLTTAPAVVESAVAAGVQRITVLTGTDEELAVVDAVEASGLEWTHVRPLEFMANKLAWAESIRAEGVVRSGFAQHTSALVHEADVAAVLVAALTEDGHAKQTYTPTGPEPLTRLDAARIIGEVTGRPVRFDELSEQQVRADMAAQGVAAEVADFVIGYESSPPPEAALVLPVVEQVTGRPPRSFADWVGEHADEFRP